MEYQESEQNKRLRQKFNFDKYGFYAVTPFIDAKIGFGCKRKLNPKDTKNVSGIGIYIPQNTYDASTTRKAFYVTATYGEELAEGIRFRSEYNFREPVDLEFRDEFFYDTKSEKIFEKDKEISADDLLLEVYEKHIKPTKPFRGFFLRIELKFWRIWLPKVISLFSSLFHYLLLIISGDRYSYQFLFDEERQNGLIISSKMEGRIGRDTNRQTATKEQEKEASKIQFFGIDVPQWPIVFYSILHLLIWFLLKCFYADSDKVEEFFNNNFLVVLYAVVSFWLTATVLPFILKKLVKYFSTLAFRASEKKVKV